MSVVQQPNIPPAASSTKLDPPPPSSSSPADPPLPPLLTLDFSANPTLHQVTTLLRRVWHIDPPLTNEELADGATIGQCLQSVTQTVSDELSASTITTTSSQEEGDKGKQQQQPKWQDDETWKHKTQFRLLQDPVVISAEKEKQAQAQSVQAGAASDQWLQSVLSPWREEIYDVYRHVFADLWRMVVATTTTTTTVSSSKQSSRLGVFEPTKGNAVAVAALPLPSTSQESTTTTSASAVVVVEETTSTSFQTDTFLYPVWVNPRAKISFSLGDQKEDDNDDVKHSWTAVGEDNKTWTTGLWVRARQTIAVKTELLKDEGSDAAAADEELDQTGLAAVFVTGHCDERRTE